MMPYRICLATAFTVALACAGLSPTRAADRPNVLFIAVDDLRPELGCYGHPMVQSPNIDRLAATGVRFDRAYCMVAVCGASRASLMTGIRPTYTRFVNYMTRASEDAPDAVTMNTHFTNSGYYTVNNGKFFHHADDNNHGWSESAWRPKAPGPGFAYFALPENQRLRQETGNTRGVPYECADVPDNAYRDGKTTDKSIEDMRRLAERDEPFFLAVGYLKPHLPFNAPKKYWDLYDPADIKLPENYAFVPEDAPACSIHNWGELRQYIGVPKRGPLPDDMAREMIHGYYACVSYTDAQVGRLLDELDALEIADNTIVVLWGDHGWNLGEHTMWCKHCVYENSMRIPTIIRVPGDKQGTTVDRLIETIDLYPTLCELTRIESPRQLEGRSLVPLLNDPDAAWKDQAVGRFVTGDTIRTDRYRYSEFHDKRGNLLGRMLYDHTTDPRENRNVLGDPAHRDAAADLQKRLQSYLEQH